VKNYIVVVILQRALRLVQVVMAPQVKVITYAAFPKLGGQHADYIKAQLIAFRAAGRDDNTDQKRVNDAAKAGELGIMQMVASKLSDKEIDALANYVSGLH
jgi:cytochrome c553